jgi:glycosyltransferase involved in cell wall biosynthesis
MNILLISHFFPPHKGGIETAAYNTAKKLTEKGHHVVVITTKVFGALNDYEKKEGFHIYRYKSVNLVELKGLPQSSHLGVPLKAILNLKKIIKKYEIQIIHAEGRFFPISLISALLNFLIFKKKMFISVQGRLKFGLRSLIEYIFDNTITRFIYSKSSKIICVSLSLKRRLIKFRIHNQNLMIIPNGVDIDEFSLKRKCPYLDKYLENAIDYKKVIFVGRLDLQKGVEYLIRAIPNVINNFTKVHFFILGNGRLEGNLKILVKSIAIEKYVTFIDLIPLEDMPKFYSAADIFCLPSIHEGFPLSIVEALSMGLIIVASNTGGIPEAIIEDENGYLFKPKNIEQISVKLLKALNLSYDEIVQIQKNNIQKAYRTYSWEKIVDEIIKTYMESN